MDDYAGNKREREAAKSRESFARTAEIGPLPDVVNRERKESCRTDLLAFLTTYFPQSTGLAPFSDDHMRMIARLQRCILFGGWMVQAVYRGFAKTTIGENACLWAALYGHREFIPLIGADKDAADSNLESIKIELEGNDLLLEDFPEACHPIRALERKSQRAASQTCNGEATRIEFSAEQIVLPYVEGSDCSGVCIRPTSIMSFNRGMKHKMPDGRQVRPEFMFIDDPQTDDSASSPTQVAKRMSKLQRTILKSAGHTGQLAVYIAATVIEPEDMIDQLLDSAKSPQWDGERVKMVRSWSDKHDDLWLGKYADVLHGWDRSNPDDRRRARREATQFYEANREAMDKGCEVSWVHCYDHDEELSAIQHAYNMLIEDGPDVFAAECQNEPIGKVRVAADIVQPDDVLQRCVGAARGVVPAWATRLTGFVDVQSNLLWYMVCAFADDFTGQIVEYGTWPEQLRPYFTKSNAKNTFNSVMPAAGPEGQIRGALDQLTDELLSRSWRHESDADMGLGLLGVDEGYHTPVIYEFCRRTQHKARVMPFKGMSIGASNRAFEEYEQRAGETLGVHWRRTKVVGKPVRHIIHDPNYWKSFVWARLLVQVGDPGALTLYEDEPNRHRLAADHIAASEYPDSKTSDRTGRTVDEWQVIPNRDNDLLDCVVGCHVAASVLGAKLNAVQDIKTGGKKRRRTTGDWAK